MLAILLAWEKGLILPGIRLEFLVESHLVLAGVMALVWGLAGRVNGASRSSAD